MADKIDQKTKREKAQLDNVVNAARGNISPDNNSNYCELCGEWADTLIDGACEPCCVKYNLK